MSWNDDNNPWGNNDNNNPWDKHKKRQKKNQSNDELGAFVDALNDKFKGFTGGGMKTPKGLGLIFIVFVILWLLSGLYRVQPDEQGVVLRFGKWVNTTEPGLNYHLPAPIENVIKPKVTRRNQIDIGFRSSASRPILNTRTATGAGRSIAEESLMVTGDENIVDIGFSVVWYIKDAGRYLFNLQNPDGTVKIAAESAMREIIGQTPILQALTEGRGNIEVLVKDRLQALLDSYEAGIAIVVILLFLPPVLPVFQSEFLTSQYPHQSDSLQDNA